MRSTLNDTSINQMCGLNEGRGQVMVCAMIDLFLEHTGPLMAALTDTLAMHDLAMTHILLSRL